MLNASRAGSLGIINAMQRFMLGCLAVAACVVLCDGCSSLQPSEEQRSAADGRPWTGGAPEPAPDYPYADLAVGLLNGIK